MIKRDEDLLTEWVRDCAIIEVPPAGSFTRVDELHASYLQWAQRFAERRLGRRSIIAFLVEQLELQHVRTGHGAGVRGVRLNDRFAAAPSLSR